MTGRFRDQHGESLNDVHQLVVATDGRRRVALLLGRRHERPCVGAALVGSAQAKLDCFEAWENPPLVVQVVSGGATRRGADWLAVLGLAQSPTAHVVLEPQTGRGASLPLRSWPGFPWHGFASMTHRENLGNVLSALDDDGAPVTQIELSWMYDPPCLRDDRDVCGQRAPSRPWSAAGDPRALEANPGIYSVAFQEPAIRRLVAGHRFFVDGMTGWLSCDGRDLGGIVSLRLWPPVLFKGEIPIYDNAKPGQNVAYREGRAYVEAEGIASVWAYVDRSRKRVVGIDLDAFDETQGIDDESTFRLTKWKTLDEPKPAGGPDDTGQCSSAGD